MSDARELSVARGLAAIEAGELSGAEWFDAYAALPDEPGAYLWRAEEPPALRGPDRGRGATLAGLPIAVKDIFCVEGLPTTAASKILEGYVPPYTATAVERLLGAGSSILGKTNMDEFAMGSSNENSAYGEVHNPWDPERVPGGSSGGSAAAVAGGLAPCAIGTDTGGSIRQPASFCGVVGLKPTYGAISRSGMIAFASSLDQCGPFTRDVTDAALLLRAMEGADPRDSTATGIAAGVELPSREDLKGLRIGVPRELTTEAEGIEEGVRELFERMVELCERLGADVSETTLPNARHGISAYYVIAPAEASANLARYDGVRFGHARERRGPRRDVRADPLGRLRPRGQAPDHARHLRSVLGLLRRLLRPRAAGPDADRARLRRRLRRLRPADHPDLAHGRLRPRRALRRPAGDVHVRLLHRADVAGRGADDLDPGWSRGAGGRRTRSGRSACRSRGPRSASR